MKIIATTATIFLLLSGCSNNVQIDKACTVTVKKESAAGNVIYKPEIETKAMSLTVRKSGGMATFNSVLYTQDNLWILEPKVIGKIVVTKSRPDYDITVTDTLNYDINTGVIDAVNESLTEYKSGASMLVKYTFNGTCK